MLDDLEFRKFLTLHGISKDEYLALSQPDRNVLVLKFTEYAKDQLKIEVGGAFQKIGTSLTILGIIIVLFALFIF